MVPAAEARLMSAEAEREIAATGLRCEEARIPKFGKTGYAELPNVKGYAYRSQGAEIPER